VLALVLGLIISAGLYFAYLWPSVEPVEPGAPTEGAGPEHPVAPGASGSDPQPASPAP